MSDREDHAYTVILNFISGKERDSLITRNPALTLAHDWKSAGGPCSLVGLDDWNHRLFEV
jgi:hypothetical protein